MKAHTKMFGIPIGKHSSWKAIFVRLLSISLCTTLQISLSTVVISVKISEISRRCIFQDIVSGLKTLKKHETTNVKSGWSD